MRWYWHRYHNPLSLRIVFATIPRLPRLVHPPIAAVTAGLFFLLLHRERRAVLSNLEVMTGRAGVSAYWSAYRVFYNFCDFIVSYCYVPAAGDGALLSMLSDANRGAATIDACLKDGGLIVWTAHAANWEFASRLLELHGRRVNVARVVERGNDAEMRLRNLMTNDRLRAVDLSDPAAVVELLHVLRAGEIVAMQGDRVYRGKGVQVPFFGRPTPFPPGPFHLAYAAGVPVVPGLVIRTGWLRYRMVVSPPIELDRSQPRDAAVAAALSTAVSFLEGHLRAWPSQWLNFFEIWPAAARAGDTTDLADLPNAAPRRVS
jgi:phosphatidylinositol dimannoside acyltransferase